MIYVTGFLKGIGKFSDQCSVIRPMKGGNLASGSGVLFLGKSLQN